jgi:hypothetical protein
MPGGSLGAPASHAICTALAGAPVRYEAKPLSLEDANGRYVPVISWPAPGSPMVGSLQYGWGFFLTFYDPRLQHFDWPTPGMHSATSGCWVGYHVAPVKGSDGQTRNAVIDATYVLDPWAGGDPIFERPATVPSIAGYRYVTASKSSNPPFEWIGIWVAKSARRSVIVAFNGEHSVVLAILPFKLSGITALPAPDAPPVGITVIGDAPKGTPVPLIELIWVPGTENGKH